MQRQKIDDTDVAPHPGVELARLMKEHGLSGRKLHKRLSIPQMRISNILAKKRAVTPDTALYFGHFFGTTPEFWLDMQSRYDLSKLKHKQFVISKTVKPLAEA